MCDVCVCVFVTLYNQASELLEGNLEPVTECFEKLETFLEIKKVSNANELNDSGQNYDR